MPETDEATALYQVAPEQFVAARDELVHRLKASGDKAGAARVAKLRRPPLTTWALNQVATTTPEMIEALVGAGADLRGAMARAVEGDASCLRPAQAAERAAIEAVVSEAATRLVRAGYSFTDVMRSRMADTLRAAIVDTSVADSLAAGTLQRDHDAPGLGLDSSLPAIPGATAAAKAGAEAPSDDDRRRDEERMEAERLEAEADRIEAEAQSLSEEAEQLAAAADRLEADAAAARQRADEARRRAETVVDTAIAAREAAVKLRSQLS